MGLDPSLHHRSEQPNSLQHRCEQMAAVLVNAGRVVPALETDRHGQLQARWWPLPAAADRPWLEAMLPADDLASQRLLADAAQADLQVRKGQLMPTLAARVEHLRNPNVGFRSNTDRALLAFEFAPGAGLSALSAVQEAEARRLAALSAIDGARLDLEQKLNSAWIDAQASVIQREPLRLLARTNAAIVDSFLRQYRVGRKNWLDVLNAQREAVQARYSLADIDAQALSGGLRVRLVAGGISGDTLAGLTLSPLPALPPPSPLTGVLADSEPASATEQNSSPNRGNR